MEGSDDTEKKQPKEQQPQGHSAMAGNQRYIRYLVFAVVVRAGIV